MSAITYTHANKYTHNHAHTEFANMALLEVVYGHISRMVDVRYLSTQLPTR